MYLFVIFEILVFTIKWITFPFISQLDNAPVILVIYLQIKFRIIFLFDFARNSIYMIFQIVFHYVDVVSISDVNM